jgi:hypothetical protein
MGFSLIGGSCLEVGVLDPSILKTERRPSPALDQMITAVDAIRPTARPAPSRESGFVPWHFSDVASGRSNGRC